MSIADDLEIAYNQWKEENLPDTQDPGPLPEFVYDKLGQKVRPGDRVVYGSGRGDLSEGIVLNFQFSKANNRGTWNYQTGSWYHGPALKMKLESPTRAGLTAQTVTIEVTRKHFAKVPHKEEVKNGN